MRICETMKKEVAVDRSDRRYGHLLTVNIHCLFERRDLRKSHFKRTLMILLLAISGRWHSPTVFVDTHENVGHISKLTPSDV